MTQWNYSFYPPSGENYSPSDYIKSLTDLNEVAIIQRRIETICELAIWEWPAKWVKKFEGVYQLTAGNHRIYFDIDDKTLVIGHVCRKVSRKARKQDISRAIANLNEYFGR